VEFKEIVQYSATTEICLEWLNMVNTENSILVEIKETIERMFSIRVTEYEEINKGLLNLKWKIITNKGTLFIKQFNEERFPTSNENRLNRLSTALLIQKSLNEEGIRCPRILTFHEEVILRTKQDIRFVITEYREGNLIHAGKINCNQFHDLGIELAKIHCLVNNQIEEKAIPRWVVPSKEQLIAQWNQNWIATNDRNTTDMNAFLKLQKEIFESIDTTIFEGSKPGWAHSDLWCDNILFYADSVSAIVDFDRFQYIYPELDIARAILSFALDNSCLRIDVVKAFIDGYNQFGNITGDDIIRSLKLLYCLESFWWLNNDSFYSSDGPPKRFADEMVWLSINWLELEKVLGELRNAKRCF
jgi:homoserine kinase type II